MNINLMSLKNGNLEELEINEVVTFDEEQLKKVGILKLENTYVNGVIWLDSLNDLQINALVKGDMYLPCSITLKPVLHPFEAKIEGNIKEILEEIGENSENLENSIDILPIIWENILMEIPMKVVSEGSYDCNMQGDGWKLIVEDEEKINPELAKLKDLL